MVRTNVLLNEGENVKKANMKMITKRTVSVNEYIDEIAMPFKQRFLETKQVYKLNEIAVQKLKRHAKDVIIVVFSADWCKDCAANVPVLALLAEKTGIKVRIFGGLKKDQLNPEETWRIPPSPIEVKKFNIQKTPTILVFDKQGNNLGNIIENPKSENALEEEILHLVQQ